MILYHLITEMLEHVSDFLTCTVSHVLIVVLQSDNQILKNISLILLLIMSICLLFYLLWYPNFSYSRECLCFSTLTARAVQSPWLWKLCLSHFVPSVKISSWHSSSTLPSTFPPSISSYVYPFCFSDSFRYNLYNQTYARCSRYRLFQTEP